MADTGWVSPSSAADPDGDWTGDSNILVEDGNTAYVEEKLFGYDILRAYNFGFSIPTGATIDGIQVRVKSKYATDAILTYVALFKNAPTGSYVGNEEQYTEDSTTLVERLEGGSTSLWGTTWSVSDINDTNFGVGVAAYGAPTGVLHIDIMQIKVYYTELAASGANVIFIGV